MVDNLWNCLLEKDMSRVSLIQSDKSLRPSVRSVCPANILAETFSFFHPSLAWPPILFCFFYLWNFVGASLPPSLLFALFQSTPDTFQGADNKSFNICGCHLPPPLPSIKAISEYLIDHGYSQTGVFSWHWLVPACQRRATLSRAASYQWKDGGMTKTKESTPPSNGWRVVHELVTRGQVWNETNFNRGLQRKKLAPLIYLFIWIHLKPLNASSASCGVLSYHQSWKWLM